MESNSSSNMKKGTELLVTSLLNEDVDVIFGYPGGSVLHIFDQFYKDETNHILVRHEQGAVHAADGYARATGKVGVAIVTSGPGATNTVTSVMTAMMDSIPLVLFTGQVADTSIGMDAFQETDVLGLMTPITKHVYQIRHADQMQQVIHEAFHVANTGRKGPVVIDVPKNIGVQLAEELPFAEVEKDLPGYRPEAIGQDIDVTDIMEGLKEAKKPVVLWGHGVVLSDASKELTEFIEKYKIPSTSSLLGKGAYSDKGDYNLGFAGMHGTYAANMALMETDYLINIGSRFDDRVASDPSNFAPHAKIVHIDIDNSEIDKVIKTDYSLLADAKVALQAMLDYEMDYSTPQEWIDHTFENRRQHPLHFEEKDTIRAERAIAYVGEKTNGEAFVVSDVGQHQMWAAQFYPFTFSNQHITSGGAGTMGYAIPAAIGAAIGKPVHGRDVVAFVGDGGFQMTAQELNILKNDPYGLNVKFFLINNEVLGMVHQWQNAFYEERYSHSEPTNDNLPDFVALSEALGVKASRVSDPAKLEEAIDEALAYDGSYVLEIKISKDDIVTPMVASGEANDQMRGVYTCTD